MDDTKREKTEDEDEITAGGLSFLQHHDLISGTDGKTHASIQCYACKRKEHHKIKCPGANIKGVNALQTEDKAIV